MPTLRRKHYVIAYDVSDDTKRTRLSNLLLDYGERVQKSVFEAEISREELQEILDRASNLIDTGDSLRAYPLCRNCVEGIESRGALKQTKAVVFKLV